MTRQAGTRVRSAHLCMALSYPGGTTTLEGVRTRARTRSPLPRACMPQNMAQSAIGSLEGSRGTACRPQLLTMPITAPRVHGAVSKPSTKSPIAGAGMSASPPGRSSPVQLLPCRQRRPPKQKACTHQRTLWQDCSVSKQGQKVGRRHETCSGHVGRLVCTISQFKRSIVWHLIGAGRVNRECHARQTYPRSNLKTPTVQMVGTGGTRMRSSKIPVFCEKHESVMSFATFSSQ